MLSLFKIFAVKFWNCVYASVCEIVYMEKRMWNFMYASMCEYVCMYVYMRRVYVESLCLFHLYPLKQVFVEMIDYWGIQNQYFFIAIYKWSVMYREYNFYKVGVWVCVGN